MRRRSKGKQHYDKDVIKRRLAARREKHAGGRSDTSLNLLLVLFIVLAIAVLGFIVIWITG